MYTGPLPAPSPGKGSKGSGPSPRSMRWAEAGLEMDLLYPLPAFMSQLHSGSGGGSGSGGLGGVVAQLVGHNSSTPTASDGLSGPAGAKPSHRRHRRSMEHV